MAKLGAFLTAIATRMGVNVADEPGFAELSASTVEIPDNLMTKFDSVELFSETSALNNQKIKNHFTALALNGADRVIEELLASHEVDSEESTRIKGEKSTYDKIKLLTAAAAKKESQKSGATQSEKASLQQQINAINAEKAQLVSQKDAEMATMKEGYENRLRRMIISGKLSAAGLDTTKLPKDVAETVAMTLLEKALTDKGIAIINDNETLRLKQSQDLTLDYYDKNNKLLTFDDFASQVLAENKLLAVTDPNPAPGSNGNQQHYYNQPPNPGAPGPRPANTSMLNSLDKALADFSRTGV